MSQRRITYDCCEIGARCTHDREVICSRFLWHMDVLIFARMAINQRP